MIKRQLKTCVSFVSQNIKMKMILKLYHAFISITKSAFINGLRDKTCALYADLSLKMRKKKNDYLDNYNPFNNYFVTTNSVNIK